MAYDLTQRLNEVRNMAGRKVEAPMLEPNDQAFPSGISRIRRIKRRALTRSTEARDAQPSRPVGVTIISVIYFIVGGALLISALALLYDLIAKPGSFVHTFILAAGLLLALVVLPFAALFIRTAMGLWKLRKWGRRLGFISAIVVLLWGLLVALQGSYQGLILVLAGGVISFYLARPGVRAQFR